MLHIVAWFDGNAAGSYGRSSGGMDFPRRLDHGEAAAWREGFMEGQRERRCHEVHGFLPCLTPGVYHPAGDTDERYDPDYWTKKHARLTVKRTPKVNG